jgi:LmbE family N-acetylglucosaminyl deacetylase
VNHEDAHRPATTVAPGPLLTVWAHPDDETYLTGGLMAAAAARGQRVVCVTATLGEQGMHDGRQGIAADLSGIRARELDSALAALGVREHVVLNYPDGGCADVDEAEAVRRLAAIVDGVGPATVVTFGPDGLTGHSDHRAVSRWTTATVAGRPGVRLLHATTTPEHVAEFADIDALLGVFPDGPPILTPATDLAVSLRLDGEALDRKLAALRAHASQTAAVVAAVGAQRFADWVATENFVAADGPPPAPALTPGRASTLYPRGDRDDHHQP